MDYNRLFSHPQYSAEDDDSVDIGLINNLSQRFAGAVPLNQTQTHISGWLLFPFQAQIQTFYRPSAAFQPPSNSPAPHCNSSPAISRTPSPGPAYSTKGREKSKASDWTEEETRDALAAWGPKYEMLRGASNKDRIRRWNQIFAAYKESYPDSERTLPQVKKRIQNLEYEFKQLKQWSQANGEVGYKKIKEGFSYFDFFDDVMGHRDSVDPSRMAIEGSSTFASEESSSHSPTSQVQEGANDTEGNLVDSEKAVTPLGAKKKATDKSDKSAKSSRKAGKKRRDEQIAATSEWQTNFLQLMEQSLDQERSREMLRESQRNQMEQTNAILAGFKDIFKDLVSK